MHNYTGPTRTRHTGPVPQTQPLNAQQVPNNAGGYGYEVDKWQRLNRFLILGSEESTYYVDQRTLTKQNFANLELCIAEDPKRTLDAIVDVSTNFKALKQDAGIFALAMLAAKGPADAELRSNIMSQFNKVVRTGTNLFHFVAAYTSQRGWSRWARALVASWYNSKPAGALEYQMLKYQSRDGWSNKDILILSHPTPATARHDALYKWAVKGEPVPEGGIIQTSRDLFNSTDADINLRAEVIRAFKLTREMLPTEMLNHVEVWRALQQGMPMQATLRNLGKMTQVGLLKPFGEDTKKLLIKLADPEFIQRSYIHPFEVILAQRQYAQGRGEKGSLSWNPVPEIMDALEALLTVSLGNVVPSNARMLVAVDVSGSMVGPVMGTSISASEAAGWMAGIINATEMRSMLGRFDQGYDPVTVSHRETPKSVARLFNANGGTDCSQPFLYLLRNKIELDAVVIFTDSETWAGNMHVEQAVAQYRNTINKNLRVVWCATTATHVKCVPDHPLNLGIAGFDASAPKAISEFIKGEF